MNRGLLKGKDYIEMAIKDEKNSAELEGIFTKAGGRYLETQETTMKTSEGKLILLAAGDEQLFEACTPFFAAMERHSFFVGKIGNTIKMDLVLQSVAGVQIASIVESMSLCQPDEVTSPRGLMEILPLTIMNSELIEETGHGKNP